MASPITKKLHESIVGHVQVLLGRGKAAFPCPLDLSDQRLFWHKTFDPDIVQAYHKLHDQGFDMRGLTFYQACFDAWLDRTKFQVKFVYDGEGLQRTRAFLSRDIDPELGSDEVRRALPNDVRYDDFVQWCRNCAVVQRDFSIAAGAISDVLNFCTTVGQLKRAVPDLVDYMPVNIQEELSEQTRASNMPHKWAGYDRDRIEILQTSMAKAHLMKPIPHTSGVGRRWDGINQTWVTYG